MEYSPVVHAVVSEAVAAQEKYGDFSSTHESYGVLAEEMAELLDAIRSNKMYAVAREASQVAAVALRLAEISGRGPETDFAKRSGVK